MTKQYLDDRNILITGASSGIGRAVARGLAKMGARVGLMSRRKGNLQEVAGEITDSGGEASYRMVDVTDPGSVAEGVGSLLDEFGKVDGLINNAGVGTFSKPFPAYKPGEIDWIVDTNVKGIMYTTLAVFPHMAEKKEGRIVNTSSLSTFGYNQLPYFSVYAATKWAVNGFTKHLAFDAGKLGITVNAVLPGWTISEMTAGDYIQDFFKKESITPIPAEKLVPFYAFYFTKEGKHVSGTLAMVDHVLDAVAIGKGMPEGEQNWAGISKTLKQKYSKREMVDLGTNKKLVDYLIKCT